VPERRVRLEEITWPEAATLARNPETVILIPCGSTEQHGPHLPLGTDSINVAHLCEAAAAQEDATLVTPCIRLGVSHNHMDFPGTITLEPETLIAIVVDTLRSLYRHGFRRFLIVNGHGGNNATLDVAAIKARNALPDAIIGHSYSAALGKEGYERATESGIVYHADEGETAKSLAVSPDLVRMARATEGLHPQFLGYYERYYKPGGEMTGTVSYGLPPTICLTATGVMGDAPRATPEKGRLILGAAVARLREVIRDVKAAQVPKPVSPAPREVS